VIFFSIVTSNTMPIRQQSAHPYDNHLDVCGVAVVSRGRQGKSGGGRVQAIHHHHTVLRFYMV